MSFPFLNIFASRKPVIGMVHLLPLIGSPNYAGSVKEIIDRAVRDAKTLERAGFDGLIVENYGDVPFYPGNVPAETIACMTRVASEVVAATSLPVGVNVLRNDAGAALAIAASVGARFIRTNVHVGVTTSEQGFLLGKAHQVLRYRSTLQSKCLIFADISVKHSYPLVEQSVDDLVKDVSERGLADAVIVTGQRTGEGINMDFLEKVVGKTDRPVFVGSGISSENITAILEIADGVIVGTSLKRESKTSNPVDAHRAEKVLKAAGAARNGK